jgi:hypothetical protein
MDNESYTLFEVFAQYIISHQPSGPIAEVADLLASGDFSKSAFDELCSELAVQQSPTFREELLDLLLFYIKLCLKDHKLTAEEMLTIRQLKIIFRIKEADLYKLKREDVKELLTIEIRRILNDKIVDQSEALHKVDLQRVLNLSYDQYLELTKEPIERIVDDLIAKISADRVVTNAEGEELFRQIIALDTVYNLNPAQKRKIEEGIDHPKQRGEITSIQRGERLIRGAKK